MGTDVEAQQAGVIGASLCLICMPYGLHDTSTQWLHKIKCCSRERMQRREASLGLSHLA